MILRYLTLLATFAALVALSATVEAISQTKVAFLSSSSDLLVYDDDLRAPWFHITYNSTVTMTSTEQAYEGSSSMKVTASAWGWVSAHHGPWNTAGFRPEPYKSVDFVIFPTSPATSVAVFLENDKGQSFPKIPKGTFEANRWNVVSVAMNELNPNSQEINRIFIQEFSGAAKIFYIDNLRFVGVMSAPGAPNPLSPSNGATGISINPTLSWNASADAASYQLQVSPTADFSTTIVNQSAITGTSAAANGLSNGTTYYWRVNAKNSGGASPWSSVWSFTTIGAAPAIPSLSAPQDRASNQPTTVTLHWNSVTGAQSYHLQVSVSSSFTTTILNEVQLTGTSWQVTGLAANTQYFWRVRAQNSGGTSGWSSIWSFTTTAGTPAAPPLLSPIDGAANQSTSLTLSWNAVSAADSYRLQLSTTTTFSSRTVDDSLLTSTSKQVSGLTSNTRYYWRVRAQNQAGASGWSAIRGFTTASQPMNAPALISPPDGSTNQQTAVTLLWNSVASASKYHLQLSTLPSFTTTIVNDSSLITTSKEIQSLSPGKQYYWRVRAINPPNASAWSAIWGFTTRREDSTGTLALNATIEFPERAEPSNYSQSDYKIIGLPGASSVPASQIIPGTPRTDWQLFWDNGAPSDYLVPYDGSSTFSFSIGRAFWMVKRGNWVINTAVPAAPMNGSREVELPLHEGWNLITNPFTVPLRWSVIRALNSVTDPIYKFGNGTFSLSDTLKPYGGYYFFNAVNANTLRIPSPPAPSSDVVMNAYSSHKQTKSNLESNWQINVTLRTGLFVDPTLWFGTADSARSDWDIYDMHKPRGGSSSPGIGFHRPQWDLHYSWFASDIRPPTSSAEEWEFTVNAIPGQRIQLHFENIETLPQEYVMYLVDKGRSTTKDIRTQPTYEFTPSQRSTELVILAGKPKEIFEKLPQVPSEFSLSVNYPNPFNPTTTIEFTVGTYGHTSLQVFDVLGRVVAVLADEVRAPGVYRLTWDASAYPSGIYLCRMRAGNFVATNKMTLLK